MTKKARCLVIDTDIARAAGQANTQNERSRSCRDFLETMRDTTQHKVVLTRAIRTEWNKHQSLATLTWRSTMISTKRVCWLDDSVDEELRRKVGQCTTSEKKRDAMLKDIHLIEAALQADKIVISMDETVRQCFHGATRKVGVLRQIAWVNPCKSEEAPIGWLQGGAALEKERLLGDRTENSQA